MGNPLRTILFGNGLNRMSPGCPSWSDLLASINANPDKCAGFDLIPFTFQYEILLPQSYYMPKPVKGERASTYTIMYDAEQSIKESLCEKLSLIPSNPFYERLARLNANNYLTTNYEYLLHDVMRSEYKYDSVDFSQERRYSLRRRKSFYHDGTEVCNIWSIHGEIMNPRSLMLGLDHYCESIGKTDEYLKGKGARQDIRRDSMEKRLAAGTLKDNVDSWIDLFFCTDVHIVGFGMDYSETDIWWLLNRRMRLFKKYDGLVRPNKIYYYGDADPDKAHMLRKFGVTYIEIPLAEGGHGKQYEEIFDMLGHKIGQR